MRVPLRSGLALTLLHLGLVASAARAVPVEQIRDPRPNGWAVDLTGTLAPERLAELDRLGGEVKSATGAELAVVVVGSTDGVDSRAFATRLFNAWGLGRESVLVFAALTDHRAEIVLGKDRDSERNRQESAAVMREILLPRFRAGEPTGAVVQGALACAQRILGVPASTQGAAGSAGPTQASGAENLAGVAATSEAPSPAPLQTEPRSDTSVDPAACSILIGLITLVILAVVAGIGRLRAHRCPRCKEKMTRLDETADDAYLQPSEQAEERVRSVNYKVWLCPACGEHETRGSTAFFSSYKQCPECKARTLSTTSTTLVTATQFQFGQIEVHQACANCSYKNSFTQTTPMLTDTSSSSDSFSSTDSSSAPSSSSSSASSGGDSAGGGASGSW